VASCAVMDQQLFPDRNTFAWCSRLDAQCEQSNHPHSDNQHCERYRIVVQPIQLLLHGTASEMAATTTLAGGSVFRPSMQMGQRPGAQKESPGPGDWFRCRRKGTKEKAPPKEGRDQHLATRGDDLSSRCISPYRLPSWCTRQKFHAAQSKEMAPLQTRPVSP
jgi:hypothetical protein